MASKSGDAILSFRDIASNPPDGFERRKKLLYKPAHDLAFDIEMGKRASGTLNQHNESHEAVASQESGEPGAEPIESHSVEFGTHPGIDDRFDEDTLERLAIPPPPAYYAGSERELRPSAVFIYNRSIGLLKTNQIIGYVLQHLTGKEASFEHLEWIDDFSCVLAFTSTATAIEAFTRLLFKPDEVEGENGLPEAIDYLVSGHSTPEVLAAASDFVLTPRPAKPFSSTLFDPKPANILLCPTRPDHLIPFVRFATFHDVKEFGAQNQSLFYALHGRGAGKQGVEAVTSVHTVPSGSGRPAGKRRRPSPQREDLRGKAPAGRWNHEELPDTPSYAPSSSRLSRRIASGRSRPGAKSVTCATLDDELERFMSKSGNFGQSSTEASELKGHDSDDDGRSRKRAVRSSEFHESPVELFANRPRAGGGNLRDDAFKRQPGPGPHQTSAENEDMTRIESEDTGGVANLPPKVVVVENVAYTNDDDSGKNIQRGAHSQGRKPKPAGRWGPLFDRLC